MRLAHDCMDHGRWFDRIGLDFGSLIQATRRDLRIGISESPDRIREVPYGDPTVPPKISAFPKCYLDKIAGERSMSVFDWIEQAKALDADGLEMYEGFFTSLDHDYIDRVGEAIASAGFAMPMLCCSPDFTHPDLAARESAGRAAGRDDPRHPAARAASGPSAGSSPASATRASSVSEGLDRVVPCIEESLVVAREANVVLGLENHYKDGFWAYPEFAQKREVFLALLDAIPDRTHFGVQFDPSNAIVAGDDPVALARGRRRSGGQHARQRPIPRRRGDPRRPPPGRRDARLLAQPPPRRDRQGAERLRRHLPDPGRPSLSKAGSASRTA